MKHSKIIYVLLFFVSNMNFLYAHDAPKIPLLFIATPEFLEKSIDLTYNFAVENQMQDSLSQGFYSCYKAIQDKENTVALPDLFEAIPDMIQVLQTMDSMRALRPSAGKPLVGPDFCELGPIIQLLLPLQDQLLDCCRDIHEDFLETWTILADINASLTTNFQSTFTVLADIKDTITECCADLTDTITTNFQFTFTALADIKDTITECCADLTDTITECCAGLTETITTNFQSTFTILAFVTACLSTPIYEAIVIDAPGTYCLANDITGTIEITSDNVTLNLNEHTINNGAVLVGPGSNRVIENGAINNAANGIVCDENINTLIRNISITNGFTNGILFTEPSSDCTVEGIVCQDCGNGINVEGGLGFHINNFVINNSSGNGIMVADATKIVINKGNIENSGDEGINIITCSDIQCSAVTIEAATNIGMHFEGLCDSAILKNVIVARAAQGIIADDLSDSFVEHCKILDCSTDINANIIPVCGIGIHDGTNNQIDNCAVKNYTATGSAFIAGFRFNGDSFIIRNCTAQEIAGAALSTVHAFSFAGTLASAIASDCLAINIAGGTVATGFFLAGEEITINNAVVRSVLAIAGSATGFINTGDNSSLTYCQAYDCGDEGFNISAPAALLQYCQSSYNDTGFLIQTGGITVGNCVATQNTTGAGFNTTVAGVPVYHCFATDNGTNYLGGVINVNNASDQVDPSVLAPNGPFAGANIFVP